MAQQADWLKRVEHCVKQHANGGFLVLFPDYRPDLCMAMSNGLGLDFYDYRKEEMLKQGLAAGSIPLDAVTKSLHRRAQHSGMVAQNVEAALATWPAADRARWFNSFLTRAWPGTVIVPCALFQSDAPQGHPNICDLQNVEMPGLSYLMRLAT